MSKIDNGPVFTVTGRELFDWYFGDEFQGYRDMLDVAERVACMPYDDIVKVRESYEGDLAIT
jgi:hypothetical protein